MIRGTIITVAGLCRCHRRHGRALHCVRAGVRADSAGDFVVDGANPRSVAARIAGGCNLPFATDMLVDAIATPTEIDHARGRLEIAARERGFAIGMASALPASIERIAKWVKAAESRGLQLVPITAVAPKAKQS